MKQLNIALILLFSVLICVAMPLSAQRKKPAKKPSPVAEAENTSTRNGILLKAKGFKVSEAYLVFDDETLVPEGNHVELNQNVNMLVIIEEGWTETAGRVFPGSRQVIKLNTGEELLKTDDFFSAFEESGVPPEDARYITLNTVVTEIKNKKNYAVISFKIWDKKGSAEISGSYRLYIK